MKSLKFKTAEHFDGRGRITILNVLILLGLLVLPAMALYRGAADFRWVAPYVIVIGALTFWAYAHDKRKAKSQEWRVPELPLHVMELIGGWPGAFLAQRRLRHKCSRAAYQCVFWIIVLAYQCVALDSLQDWGISRAALDQIKRL